MGGATDRTGGRRLVPLAERELARGRLGDQDGPVVSAGSAARGDVAARRRLAARWTVAAVATGLVAVLVGLAVGRVGVVVGAASALVLQLLPALRAQAILRGRRRHFQPFLLLLLVLAGLVPLVVGATVLADGGVLSGSALLAWAVVSAAAVLTVQRSHLLT